MLSFGHLSVQIWIRQFSSPGTPSQSYGRFASKWLHLDTFLSGSGSSHVRTQRKSLWHNSVCAKWTFWPPAVHVSEHILTSGRRKKYLFCRAVIVRPLGPNPPHPTPQRCRNKRFGARTSSFVERNEISPRWPQWEPFKEGKPSRKRTVKTHRQ